jgi:hypothetical protein
LPVVPCRCGSEGGAGPDGTAHVECYLKGALSRFLAGALVLFRLDRLTRLGAVYSAA